MTEIKAHHDALAGFLHRALAVAHEAFFNGQAIESLKPPGGFQGRMHHDGLARDIIHWSAPC